MVADEFTFLVTTDNHLGIYEGSALYQDQLDDSFLAFEEVMGIAKDRQVDAILHGGDMFHQSSPSKETFSRVADILSRSVFGPRKVTFDVESDPSDHFDAVDGLNFQDPNHSVSIPMFAIHGNHDYPNGVDQVSALDIMARGRWLNYMGKVNPVDTIHVKPVLLSKNGVKVALYGLGWLHERKLHELLSTGKVVFHAPPDADEYTSILMVHQNRRARKVRWFLDITFIPHFIDVIIWGHEHDPTCTEGLPERVVHPVTNKTILILQLGSTVATSLTEGEAGPKLTALLTVAARPHPCVKLSVITLHNYRPIVIRQIAIPTGISDDAASAMVRDKLQLMGAGTRGADVNPAFRVPLLRLKVTHDGARLASNYSPIAVELAAEGVLLNPHNAIVKSTKRDGVAGGAGAMVTEDPKLENLVLDRLVGDGSAGQSAMAIIPATVLMEQLETFISARGNLAEMVIQAVKGVTDGLADRMLGLAGGDRAIVAKENVMEADKAGLDARPKRSEEVKADVKEVKVSATAGKRKAPRATPVPRAKRAAVRASKAAALPMLVDEDEEEADDWDKMLL